jgi:DNA-binding CsgD family transcriptional regulator
MTKWINDAASTNCTPVSYLGGSHSPSAGQLATLATRGRRAPAVHVGRTNLVASKGDLHPAINCGEADLLRAEVGATACRRPGDLEAPPSDGLTEALLEALTWFAYGIILANEKAQILFASPVAAQLLATRRLNTAGVLLGRTAAETAKLHRLITHSANGPQMGAATDPPFFARIGDPPLFLQLAPLERMVGGRASHLVLVTIVDPGHISPPPELLRQQFDLTAAESVFAREIVRGQGLKACARLLGISETTARTHLGRIFDKTGTRRQAELVHVILASRLALRLPMATSRTTRSSASLRSGC